MFIVEQSPLQRLCQQYLGGTAQELEKHSGLYADVSIVRVGRLRAVVKCYYQAGQAQLEADSLNLLRQHSPGVLIPEVIAVHARVDSGEALLMSYVPGIPASHALESPVAIDRFADECTDLLLHWHSTTRPTGFHGTDGRSYNDFPTSYRAFLAQRVAWLSTEAGVQRFELPLRERLVQLAGAFDTLPQPVATTPSLIHDECHAANFLVDPDSQRLCGVIDPCQARFAHRELDLLHLSEVRPDFKLLASYLAKAPQDANLRTRLAYYGVFDDIKHAAASRRAADAASLWRKIEKLEIALADLPPVEQVSCAVAETI